MTASEYVGGALELARRQADRVVSPSMRAKLLDGVQDFGMEHPILLSFLLAQSLFALIPVLLFTSFVLGVLCVALVSALLFILFWIGVAGLVLGGTLFVTFWVAVVVWTWGVGLFLAGRFAYGLVVARQGTGHDVGEKKMREKWEQIVAKKEEEEPEVNGSKTKAIVNGDGEKHEDGSMGNEKEETNGVNGDGAHEEHQDDSTSTVPLNGDASTR